MSHCLWDAAWTCVFERKWAIPQKQHNCATFVASKLRVGNISRLINSYWFQLGRAVAGHFTAPQRHTVVKTKYNTDIVDFSLLFQIYRATAAFTSKVWQSSTGLHFGSNGSSRTTASNIFILCNESSQISIQRANTVHENAPGVNHGSCAVVSVHSSNKHRRMAKPWML